MPAFGIQVAPFRSMDRARTAHEPTGLHHHHQRLDLPIATAVPILMLINIGVYFLWLVLSTGGQASPFMVDHFLVSMTALKEQRYWTLLTSAFSHQQFWHLFLNLYVLGSFGDAVEESLGSRRFTLFYVSAAVVSALTHVLVSTYFLHAPNLSALGASGAISGLILLFSLQHPREKIFLFGLIPVAAAWGSAIFIGLDLWGLFAQRAGGGLPIGHGAHLGGAMVGIIYHFYSAPFSRNQKGSGIHPSTD
jgi:membrane associated rhomboid family serine protease